LGPLERCRQEGSNRLGKPPHPGVRRTGKRVRLQSNKPELGRESRGSGRPHPWWDYRTSGRHVGKRVKDEEAKRTRSAGRPQKGVNRRGARLQERKVTLPKLKKKRQAPIKKVKLVCASKKGSKTKRSVEGGGRRKKERHGI